MIRNFRLASNCLSELVSFLSTSRAKSFGNSKIISTRMRFMSCLVFSVDIPTASESIGKQQRLDALRVREAQEILSEAERAEMEALFVELDAEEAEAMRPALERMQHQQAELFAEKKRLRAEAAQLERIISAQEQLLAEARSYLVDLRTKRAALADEYRRITMKG